MNSNDREAIGMGVMKGENYKVISGRGFAGLKLMASACCDERVRMLRRYVMYASDSLSLIHI